MISKPGIYPNVREDQYHADDLCEVPTLSRGTIADLIYRSPHHAWWNHPRLNPDFVADHDDKFDLGLAAHDALLCGLERVQPLAFDDFRTKAARISRAGVRAAGKLPVLIRQFDEIKKMVTVARQFWTDCDDLAGFPFEDGETEVTGIWQEGTTWCRVRWDWLAHDGKLQLDYKTTDMIGPDWPRRAIVQHGIDIQCAFYTRGVEALFHRSAPFILLVQEVSPPYAVMAFALEPAFREIGQLKCENGLRIWRECLASNAWPSYPSRIHWIEPTAYQLADAEAMG